MGLAMPVDLNLAIEVTRNNGVNYPSRLRSSERDRHRRADLDFAKKGFGHGARHADASVGVRIAG